MNFLNIKPLYISGMILNISNFFFYQFLYFEKINMPLEEDLLYMIFLSF